MPQANTGGLIRATSRREAWDYRKTVRGGRDQQGVFDLPRCRGGNRRRWVGFVERLTIDRMTIQVWARAFLPLRTQADVRLTLVASLRTTPVSLSRIVSAAYKSFARRPASTAATASS